MKTKEELDLVWDMLHRAMMVINDLTGHYEPNWRGHRNEHEPTGTH